MHRVDYRLRPDPGSTPTAVSLASAYVYYETVGQNWERAALIKARPVAGDLALGETFLNELRPFIWRKYFDFASIADVHAMKRQIHAVRGHDEIAVAGHDIKLGRGGIREIEFFVQTQQLVFGGRRPGLRGRRTLDMLKALHDEGWITAKARDELSEAYRFLRTIEHRLQMVADEQTQRLPSDEEQLKRFAKFCGYPTVKAFSKALTDQAKIVQGHYALLFEEGPELATDVGSLVFTGSDDDPDTLATLQRLGFREPERVAETVRGWHFGRRPAIQSARAREVLTELTPALLSALGGTADPDGALAALDRAFGRMPAAVELLTILQSHDRLRASLRRSSRHRAAPRRHGGAIAACARCAHRSRLRHAHRRRRGHREPSAPAHRPAARLRGLFGPRARCGAADALRHRRAAALGRALAGAGRRSLCRHRARRHPHVVRGSAPRVSRPSTARCPARRSRSSGSGVSAAAS